MEKLLIVGYGDIARRATPALARRFRITALVRRPDPSLERSGVATIVGDLDHPESLAPLAGYAQRIAHLAPPPPQGEIDVRSRNLLAALAPQRRPGMLPQRIVYLSTSGVYGDCGGAQVDESHPPAPRTARAKRRLDAERSLSEWAERHAVEIAILRVPGIYASDRLPLEHLRRGLPVLRAEEDVYTNHVHADDLAAIVVLALAAPAVGGIYNACDDSEIKMGDWLDQVADRCGLPRPERIPRAEAERRLPPEVFSFMCESRRLSNRRIKAELGVRLAYPTVAQGLSSVAAAH